MDTADAVYLMARAVDGLFHAHTAATPDGRPLQLVHRDFSPSNILVGYDGSVKIIDFGIAKANVERERTAAGIIKGKVKYMSPEQAQGDDKLTEQSDVFIMLKPRAAWKTMAFDQDVADGRRSAAPLRPRVGGGTVGRVQRSVDVDRRADDLETDAVFLRAIFAMRPA